MQVRGHAIPWTLSLLLCAPSLGCGRFGYLWLPAASQDSPAGQRDASAAGDGADGSIAAQADAGDLMADDASVAPANDAGFDAATPADAAVASGDSPADAHVEAPDGATVDVHAGHRYVLLASTYNWSDAAEQCRALALQLVQIESQSEQEFVFGFIASRDTWLGATDVAQEGAWHWADGGPQFWQGNETSGSAVGDRFVYWDPGVEPNNAGASEHCAGLRIARDGRWVNLPCEILRAALCESL